MINFIFTRVSRMGDRDVAKICVLCQEPFLRLSEHYRHKTAPCYQIVMRHPDPAAYKTFLVQQATERRRDMLNNAGVVNWTEVWKRAKRACPRKQNGGYAIVDIVRFVVEDVMKGVFYYGDSDTTKVCFFFSSSYFQYCNFYKVPSLVRYLKVTVTKFQSVYQYEPGYADSSSEGSSDESEDDAFSFAEWLRVSEDEVDDGSDFSVSRVCWQAFP